MQTRVIRHDGLERMIRAYLFFAALVQRLRDSGALTRCPVRSRQEQPATAA
ncbi:MAG: hypothetical protein AMXMBFR52_10330 [Burkholderiales bacterium]